MRSAPSFPRNDRIVFRWTAAIFLSVILEGAARKWLLPQPLAPIAYFAKDIIAALFLVTTKPHGQSCLLRQLERYVAVIALCLLPAFLIGLATFPIGAFVTYKNATLWPLFAIRMASAITAPVVAKLRNMLLVSGVFMGILAALQYFSSPDSALNRYAWEKGKVAAGTAIAGSYVRATGTFSFITGLSSFAFILFCIFLGNLLLANTTRHFIVGTLGLASAGLCGVVTGSRGVETFFTVVLAITLALVPKTNGLRVGGTLLATTIICFLILRSSLASGMIDRWRQTDASDFIGRASGESTGQPIGEILSKHPIGMGLGLYSGYSSYSGKEQDLDLPYNEAPSSRVAAEAGVPGLVAMFLTALIPLSSAHWIWRTRLPRKSGLIPTAIGSTIASAYCFWYDHTTAALWWWAIAIWLGEAITSQRLTLCRTRLPEELTDRMVNSQTTLCHL